MDGTLAFVFILGTVIGGLAGFGVGLGAVLVVELWASRKPKVK